MQAERQAWGAWLARAGSARGGVARALAGVRAAPLAGRDYDDFPLQEDALQVPNLLYLVHLSSSFLLP